MKSEEKSFICIIFAHAYAYWHFLLVRFANEY